MTVPESCSMLFMSQTGPKVEPEKRWLRETPMDLQIQSYTAYIVLCLKN